MFSKNTPSSLVLTEKVSAELWFVAVMVAPEMTAPFGSKIIPVIAPLEFIVLLLEIVANVGASLNLFPP